MDKAGGREGSTAWDMAREGRAGVKQLDFRGVHAGSGAPGARGWPGKDGDSCDKMQRTRDPQFQAVRWGQLGTFPRGGALGKERTLDCHRGACARSLGQVWRPLHKLRLHERAGREAQEGRESSGGKTEGPCGPGGAVTIRSGLSRDAGPDTLRQEEATSLSKPLLVRWGRSTAENLPPRKMDTSDVKKSIFSQ